MREGERKSNNSEIITQMKGEGEHGNRREKRMIAINKKRNEKQQYLMILERT